MRGAKGAKGAKGASKRWQHANPGDIPQTACQTIPSATVSCPLHRLHTTIFQKYHRTTGILRPGE